MAEYSEATGPASLEDILRADVRQANRERDEALAEVEQLKAQIREGNARFDATVKAVTSELQEDHQNMLAKIERLRTEVNVRDQAIASLTDSDQQADAVLENVRFRAVLKVIVDGIPAPREIARQALAGSMAKYV